MIVPCDGCFARTDPAALKFVTADGHEARYCEECHTQYTQFAAACLVLEEKYNRLLDLEIQSIRERTGLLLVPQDLPRHPRALEGMILG